MPTEFCDHLGDYGVQYVRAEAAYRAMLVQLERVAAGAVDDDALDLLERMVRDWRDEVKVLRKRFSALARGGHVVLPRAKDAAAAPACAACGAALPRLEFADFTVSPEGSASYRGRALPVPAGA